MTTADPLIAHLVIPRHCAPYGAQDRFNITGASRSRTQVSIILTRAKYKLDYSVLGTGDDP
ncbi:unnamed protein product [Penicillium roqueforti FM164]|uniref:Genomic scaffold, ProqFM164S01 n=1 Tax=Penicillium roqueforti (strain FM164) TaxID=1365484 RepID=W6QDK3_PENRF|nr:unnamed protein product [Penicillium roqueforti FM164]